MPRYTYVYGPYDRRGNSGDWAMGIINPPGTPAVDQIATAISGLNFRLFCDVDAVTVRCERALTVGEQSALGDIITAIQDAG